MRREARLYDVIVGGLRAKPRRGLSIAPADSLSSCFLFFGGAPGTLHDGIDHWRATEKQKTMDFI